MIRLALAQGLSTLIAFHLIFNHDYWYLIPLFILQLLAGLNFKIGGEKKWK
jgi:hypothetical protein